VERSVYLLQTSLKRKTDHYKNNHSSLHLVYADLHSCWTDWSWCIISTSAYSNHGWTLGSFWYISGILIVIMLAELFVCFLGMDQENRDFNLFQSVSNMCKMSMFGSFYKSEGCCENAMHGSESDVPRKVCTASVMNIQVTNLMTSWSKVKLSNKLLLLY
jgi:hypothetical protein